MTNRQPSIEPFSYRILELIRSILDITTMENFHLKISCVYKTKNKKNKIKEEINACGTDMNHRIRLISNQEKWIYAT